MEHEGRKGHRQRLTNSKQTRNRETTKPRKRNQLGFSCFVFEPNLCVLGGLCVGSAPLTENPINAICPPSSLRRSTRSDVRPGTERTGSTIPASACPAAPSAPRARLSG